MGYHWRLTPPKRDAIRHVLVDINHWKTHLTTSLATALGDPGALSLWGRDPERHRLLADHLAAEFPTETTARGRTIYEWRARPSRPDNHWLDCLVYAYAAAAMLGAHPTGATGAGRRRVKMSERQARRPVHAH
jgi:phage terminase large subunit GpA-like protein